MGNESFKYYAFISYSHKDKKIAKKLQRHLEHYHLPAALAKSNPALPKKLSPIFRDETDLIGRGTLKETLQQNLDSSNYLILICSPSSARSEYVNDEVKHFIELGRVNYIIPLIVDGVPHSGGDTECFPQAILELPRENELLGIDLKTFGVRESFVRVIATLLRLDIGAFVSRYRKERRRNIILLASALVTVIITVIILMPPPYDETLAENVMVNALGAYARAGHQYENLRNIAESAANDPENFNDRLKMYKNQISYKGMVAKYSLQYLSDMMETGKVMPWSREPMNQEECAELLTLADNREKDYERFASVLEFVMTDDFARRFYGTQYPELLLEFLDVDAKITARLYQIVCVPHLSGKFVETDIATSLPIQNKLLTNDSVKESRVSLSNLRGDRIDRLSKLNSCGAFEAYDVKQNKEE